MSQLRWVQQMEEAAADDTVNIEKIGEITYMSPRPTRKHVRIATLLAGKINAILERTENACAAYIEQELRLQDDVLVPDISVDCYGDVEEAYLDQPPVLVIEVVSPSSMTRDWYVKKEAYQRLGVQEYWIVSPDDGCITVFWFGGGKKQETQSKLFCKEADETVRSFIMPELEIPLRSIFKNDHMA